MRSRDRLLDLLVARSTEGLSASESSELDRALSEQADLGADDLDLAAAAVDLAYASHGAFAEPMPERLRQRLWATACDFGRRDGK